MATPQLQMIASQPNVNHGHGFFHNNVNTHFTSPMNFVQHADMESQFHYKGNQKQTAQNEENDEKFNHHKNGSYNGIYRQYAHGNDNFHDPRLSFHSLSNPMPSTGPPTSRNAMFNNQHIKNQNREFQLYNQRYIHESYSQGRENYHSGYQSPSAHSPQPYQYQTPIQHNSAVNNCRISNHSPNLQQSCDDRNNSPSPVTVHPSPTITNVDRHSMEKTMPIKSNKDWELECMGVSIELATRDLWKRFENFDLEMVISKNGRRMFPPLEYDISGLEPTKFYNVFLDFVVTTDHIWKYSDHTWKPNGPAPPEEPSYHPIQRMYVHPQSPSNGETWNKSRVYFRKMKLSNHLHNEREKVVSLRTLLKYQPRLHIVEVSPHNPAIQSNLRTYVLPKTKFITVTLYHDTDVAQLKINLNPFARSFREKPLNDNSDQESQPSPMSDEQLSPLTSPEQLSDDFYKSNNATKLDDFEYAPKQIVTTTNPALPNDVNTAKLFVDNQRCTMSNLITPDCQKVPHIQRNQSFSPSLHRQCSPVQDTSTNVLPSFQECTKSNIVHHYGNEKAVNNILTHKECGNEPRPLDLDDLQLLNVDRCFPPNQMAPLNHSLPFDPNLLKQENGPNGNLPVFYECSYYRQQAAENHCRENQQRNFSQSNPVVYVPQKQTNNALDCPRDSPNFYYGNETVENPNDGTVSFSSALLSNGNTQCSATTPEGTQDHRVHCESDNVVRLSTTSPSSMNENGIRSNQTNNTIASPSESKSTCDHEVEPPRKDEEEQVHYEPTHSAASITNSCSQGENNSMADDSNRSQDYYKDASNATPTGPSSLSAQFFSSDLPAPSLSLLKQFFIDEPRNIELGTKKRRLEVDESDAHEWFAKRTCISAKEA